MSKVDKVITYSYGHAKTLTKTAKNEVIGMRSFPADTYTGYKCAQRLSKTKDLDALDKAKAYSISIIRYGIAPHLPGLFAGIATFLPVFGSAILGLKLGKMVQKRLPKTLKP